MADESAEKAADAATGAERKSLSRGRPPARAHRFHAGHAALARLDQRPRRICAVFGHYYAGRAGRMRAAATARAPAADSAVLSMLIDGLGPWLAAEYAATHGQKRPRP